MALQANFCPQLFSTQLTGKLWWLVHWHVFQEAPLGSSEITFQTFALQVLQVWMLLQLVMNQGWLGETDIVAARIITGHCQVLVYPAFMNTKLRLCPIFFWTLVTVVEEGSSIWEVCFALGCQLVSEVSILMCFHG